MDNYKGTMMEGTSLTSAVSTTDRKEPAMTDTMKNTIPAIKAEDMPEFAGQIIDIFEDFLEEKGVLIDNPERDEDADNAAILYGSDYGNLQDRIYDILRNWKLTELEADTLQR